MSVMKSKPRISDFSPLVLRLAVAGVLAAAAASRFAPAVQPVEAMPPVPVETSPEAVAFNEGADEQTQADRLVPADKSMQTDRSVVGDDRVALDRNSPLVSFGMNELTGLGEIGFAGVLLFGVLTRFAAVAGIGMVKLSALTATGFLDANSITQPFAAMYASNPIAMLLFGAICVSLLVSGSGPVSLDRILFRKRLERATDPTAMV